MLQTRIIPPAENAYPYPLLIKRLLLSGSRYEKTREIVYRDSVRYSYATFNERVARLANALTAVGVKAGDTVAVMDWDSHRYLECMFAIPMLGAVLHTINIRLSPEQILYTMNHAEDKFVLVNSEFVPLYQSIAGQLTTVEKTLLLTDAAEKSAALPGLAGEYEELLAAADTQYDFADFDENSLATTFYTTGTTGNPKGVYFTHRQLVLHTLSMASVLGSVDSIRLMGSDDVYMPITPMFHVHAWGVPYVATMLGVKQVYPGRYDPELLVKLWQKEKVTFSHCVPTILQMVMNAKAAQGVDFGGWKLIIGGSALTRAQYEAAKARGIQLTAAYGMSETCPLISCAHLNEELLAGSEDERITYRIKAGVPVPLVEAAILSADGQFLPADGESQGELVLRAPWLTQGYFREPQKGAELWEHGWLHTGDVATLDGMGFIDIRDRIKDVIKTGGEWISSL
ncbi:MAG: fatty acid--CoA ligase, partial [Pseudomonas sp.]